MLKIMIVDDDFVICETLCGIVTDLEYEVAGVADSGKAAVKMALDVKPDVILMDIVMDNGMDGIEAAGKILESLDCAVIFVTGHGEEEIFERAKQVEPHGYVLKPYLPMEVKTAIEIGYHKKQVERRLKEAFAKIFTELEQRTSELESANQKLEVLLNAPTDSMLLLDLDGTILAANSIAAKRHRMKVNEFVGKCAYDLLTKRLAKSRKANLNRVIKSKKRARFTDQRGKTIFDNSVYPIFDNDRNVVQLAIYGKDVTEEVESREKLEESKRELESKTDLLGDANMALKIMLQKSNENREEIEAEVMATLKKMVVPLVLKIKKSEISPTVREHINRLEDNLKYLSSPFSRSLSFEYISLSPKEIQVANLIRDGRVTREIAEELGMKPGTVEFYRNNIREKIGIRGKKIRLRTHLLNLRHS
jgi:DNA-binding NarL/FixJ family response regulator